MSPFDPTFSNPAMFVYHYTKIETAKEKILPSRKIRFGRFSTTNDPKECKEWRFDLWSRDQTSLLGNRYSEAANRFSRALKQNTRLICFSKDAASLAGNHLMYIHKRGFAKPRIWAQYANNHTGVCLIFNRQKLHDHMAQQYSDNCIISSAGVRYVDRAIVPPCGLNPYAIDVDMLEQIGFEQYTREHLERYIHPLFFEKMIDWRDEAEFRWVLFSDQDGDVFVEFSDSLAGIVFGDSAGSDDIETIIKLTDGLGIAHMGLKRQNSSPWYDFQNLRYSPSFRRLQREH